jgi:transposase
MACHFVAADREQLLLMPASVADWLPEDHLAWFVLDVVAELDLSEFLASYRLDGRGGAVYDPALMLAVLVYAYCTGERSSRRIERRLTGAIHASPIQLMLLPRPLLTQNDPPVHGTRTGWK